MGNVKHLILRNNALMSLRGIEHLLGLERLDLSENILADAEEIPLLSELPFLKAITLLGNPIALLKNYRKNTLCALRNERIVLDGKYASATELEVLRKHMKNTSHTIKVGLCFP